MHTVKYWALIATLLIASITISEISIASSYLQELENEAAAIDNSEQKANKKNEHEWTQQQTGSGDNIEAGLSKEDFEKALKNLFYGSYLFYSSLSDAKQQVVYEEYQNNNDIEHLRESIKTQITN